MATIGRQDDSKQRRRRWPPEVTERISELRAERRGATEIHDDLELDSRFAHIRPLPSVRTIQRLLAASEPPGTKPWRLGSRTQYPDDDHLVLGTLAAVVRATEGRVRSFTQAEADWIVRIRRARPDFDQDPMLAYRFAIRYIDWIAQGDSTAALDLQLATVPVVVAGVAHGLMDAAARRGIGVGKAVVENVKNDRARRNLADGGRPKDGGHDDQAG